MSSDESPLQKALADARETGYGYLLENRVVPAGVADAQALAKALSDLNLRPVDEGTYGADLWALAKTYQFAEDDVTSHALRGHALPELIKAFDHGVDLGANTDDLLRSLQTFLFCDSVDPDAIDRVATASILFPESARWLEIRATCVEDVDETTPQVVELLRGVFPGGDAGLWYLSWCNAVCRNDPDFVHPYDTSNGHEILDVWLDFSNPEPDRPAAATIASAFISPPARDSLLRRAEAHPALEVRIAAAFARARLGLPHGSARLVMFCDDPLTSWQAQEFLRELDLEDEIPANKQTLQWEAMTEIVDWLSRPKNGVARKPSEVSVVDSRVLIWPTEEDEREVCIVRYRCPPKPGYPDALVGYAMYGGAWTHVLVGEANTDLSPLEVYALHCCWELEFFEDPTAPAERSVEAGLEILRKHNPGLA